MKKSFLLILVLLTTFSFIDPSYVNAQNKSLADKVVGKYKGKLKNQNSDLNNYKIKISKVSDTKVKIQPASGSQSQTFEVNLTEEKMGSITVIKFKMPTEHILNNGMFVKSNGRLSYSIHLGGDSPRNIEVFSGAKI